MRPWLSHRWAHAATHRPSQDERRLYRAFTGQARPRTIGGGGIWPWQTWMSADGRINRPQSSKLPIDSCPTWCYIGPNRILQVSLRQCSLLIGLYLLFPLPFTFIASHLSPLTSHLSPLTSHLSPLTSHLSLLSPLSSSLIVSSVFYTLPNSLYSLRPHLSPLSSSLCPLAFAVRVSTTRMPAFHARGGALL
jgi:hypothetical protein